LTGSGLAVFFSWLGASLPSFILILAVIGGVVAIFVAIAFAIRGALSHSTGGYRHR